MWRDGSAVKAVPDQRPADIIPRNNVCSPRIGAHIPSCREASIPAAQPRVVWHPSAMDVDLPQLTVSWGLPLLLRQYLYAPVPALLQRPSPAAAPFRRRLKNAAVLEDAEELYLVKRLIRE